MTAQKHPKKRQGRNDELSANPSEKHIGMRAVGAERKSSFEQGSIISD